MGITIKMMTVISQTNSSEITEFLPSIGDGVSRFMVNPITYIVIAATCCCIGILKIIPGKVFAVGAGLCSIIGMILFVISLIVLPAGRTNFSVPVRVVKAIINSHREAKRIREELAKVTPLPYKDSVRSRRLTDIIMVVGESANRDNLSLYGYDLATTPKLDKLKDQLIIFTDVIPTLFSGMVL